MYPYRVFVSYSHDDTVVAARVRERLVEIGATPMSDVDIQGGTRFGEEIRRQISFAHLFVPVLTASSKTRPWVHQEIGYAIGLGVPVLPLALDELPAGMAEEIQAVRVKPDLSDLPLRLTQQAIEHAVSQSQETAAANYEYADKFFHRTQRLTGYARSLLKQSGPLRIRQRAAFSSFSIPSRNIRDPVWDQRDGPERHGDEVRELMRQERDLLEQHARAAGCDLILEPYVLLSDDPAVDLPPATRARLRILRDFLGSMPDDKVRVILPRGRVVDSLTAIGDWLLAEAVVPHYKSRGYQKTAFTRHAPTVLDRVQEFERDLLEGLADDKLEAGESRSAAIEEIERLLARRG